MLTASPIPEQVPLPGPLLLVGLGNTLLGDDGVGVHVVREVERLTRAGHGVVPAGTRIIDGGTIGLGLLPFLAGSRAVVFVDAVEGGAPGRIAISRGVATIAAGSRGPVAELVGVADLGGVLPATVVLLAVTAGPLEFDTELSAPVAAALPRACEAVMAVLASVDPVTTLKRTTAGRPDERGCAA